MAPKRKSGTGLAKSETLSIRLDVRSRFALDFVARARGQTISTVIERAALSQAIMVTIEEYSLGLFESVWHEEEGVRQLAVAAVDKLYPTHDELKRLSFARQFWPYFYREKNFTTFNVPRIQVLWRIIDDLISFFEETRSSDFFAVARRMSEMLSHAGLEGPSDLEVRETVL